MSPCLSSPLPPVVDVGPPSTSPVGPPVGGLEGVKLSVGTAAKYLVETFVIHNREFTWSRGLCGSLEDFKLTLQNCDLYLVFFYFVFFVFNLDFDLYLEVIIFSLDCFYLYFHLYEEIMIS